MNKIYLLAKTLNRLGLKKEAKELLSLKKVASDSQAWNKIRSKISIMQNVFEEIAEILYEFSEYRRADPESNFISREDEREISTKIFSKAGRALGLLEQSYQLSSEINWMRESLANEVKKFVNDTEVILKRFYSLMIERVYGESLSNIKRINIAYWFEKFKALITKCKNFIGSRESDPAEEREYTGQKITFDPSRENTVVGLERTVPGDPDIQREPDFETLTEISIPTNL